MAIARLLCQNPDIIYLDEATTKINMFEENEILKHFRRCGSVVIIASSKSSSLKHCDRILVLDNPNYRIVTYCELN